MSGAAERVRRVGRCRYCTEPITEDDLVETSGLRWHRDCALDLLTELGRAIHDE